MYGKIENLGLSLLLLILCGANLLMPIPCDAAPKPDDAVFDNLFFAMGLDSCDGCGDGIDPILLAAPTTRSARLEKLAKETRGFLYFVSLTGVTGAQLAKAIEWSGEEVSAVANNDYSVTIPFEVFADPTTLIAYENNGRPMAVRAKGPLWIVFPFDRGSKYLTDAYRSYAVWGLERVDFR